MGNDQLAQFARAVRESTLTRLRLVPIGAENWRVDSDAMSFADIAKHLIDSDRWLFEVLRAKVSNHMVGKAGLVNIGSRHEYETLIDELRESGDQRVALLERLDPVDFEERIFTPEAAGEVTVWWTILRGNLDHEIHHRGQIVAYLRTLNIGRLAG